MLEQVLLFIHNKFIHDNWFGTYAITDGTLNFDKLQNEQYFWILGSVFNDGLHQWPTNDLTDEIFTGQILALAIPKAVIDIASEIKDWQDKYGAVVDGPYQSESFSDYSYTKATSGSDSSSGGPSWQSVFKCRLSPWRKIG